MKLQKESEKTREEKKKERRREKKEKSRGDGREKAGRDRKHGKRERELLPADNSKERENDSAQLERSSLTEEHGPASGQNHSDSPDSARQRRKRMKSKHELAEVCPGASGFRIRLPLLRGIDLENPTSSAQQQQQQQCFSGAIKDVRARNETRAPGRSELPSPAEQPCVSGRADAAPLGQPAKPTPHHKRQEASADASGEQTCRCSCGTRERRLYEDLILNWNPPALDVTEAAEDNDRDWLFGKSARRAGRRVDAPEDPALGNAVCSWPPRASYLPEVGIHAPPYVVPL